MGSLVDAPGAPPPGIWLDPLPQPPEYGAAMPDEPAYENKPEK